ncbi:MAG: adenosylcobinamide-phosphate synthase CbiB, partial [Paracoccaceae bacterium]
MTFAAIMALAFAIDAGLGWPDRLFRRIRHPVVWIGRAIAGCERALNHGGWLRRRCAGGLTVLVTVALAAVPALALQMLLPDGWITIAICGIIAWPLLAVRSMHDHVQAVQRPLAQGDLDAARHAVSMIVGRDPSALDQAGVARAALESLAENTSDGIVAPLFWGVVAGLPGICAYKAINTLDSMIGHRNPRYEEFGKSAARLDDLANLIPARLTGGLFALVSTRPKLALRLMLRDARHHRSPNAGWPEAAMAGALNIRLSGPRIYGARISQEPWVNAGAPDPDATALAAGLALYRRTMQACAVLLFGLA